MANHIVKEGGLDETNSIYCSPATRAQRTIASIVNSSNLQKEWVTQASLYTFNPQDLLEICQNLDDTETNVTLVGHNPAIHDLVESLTGYHIPKLPTCSYVQLDCAINRWEDLTQKCASLTCFIYPKMFAKN